MRTHMSRQICWFYLPFYFSLSLALTAAPCHGVAAAEPSHFAAARYKAAELRFIEGLPVVTVEGSPEEMGEQLGTLFKQPLAELSAKQEEFVRGLGFGQPPAALLKMGGVLLPWFPESHRRELQATAKASDFDESLLIFGNLMYELSPFPACSELAVEPARSKSGQPLFGRNVDFPTFGFLDKYSVVVVYRPKGKHAFASITFPGFVGAVSGMNDAGLCVAQLEVDASAEKSSGINLTGTPVSLCFRRLLEECSTVDEAEKLLRDQSRLIMCNLAVCDRQQAAVLEITTSSVIRRAAERGLCACTNHFRTKDLAVDTSCRRYAKLEQAQHLDKLAVSDVAALLNAVNQGNNTMQTMVFEPVALRAHLSFGPLPSSSQPLKSIDLTPLLHGDNQPVRRNVPEK